MDLIEEVKHSTWLFPADDDHKPAQNGHDQCTNHDDERQNDRGNDPDDSKEIAQPTCFRFIGKRVTGGFAIWFRANVGPLVIHQAPVTVHTDGISQPRILQIPNTLIAFTGEQNDPPLKESKDLS